MDAIGIVTEVAFGAARRHESSTGTPWRETLGEAWLTASDGRPGPRRKTREIERISDTLDAQEVEEIDPVLAGDLHPPADPSAGLRRAEIVRGVADELLRLSPRAERIIRLRYGLGGGPAMTCDEIARTMDVTGARIHALEQQMLKRLGSRAVRQRLMWIAPESIQAAIVETLAQEREAATAEAARAAAQQKAWLARQPSPPPSYVHLPTVVRIAEAQADRAQAA